MLPAGLAHAVGLDSNDFAFANDFVLAIHNTFITAMEPARLVRRHSWPTKLDEAGRPGAMSGFEGDDESDCGSEADDHETPGHHAGGEEAIAGTPQLIEDVATHKQELVVSADCSMKKADFCVSGRWADEPIEQLEDMSTDASMPARHKKTDPASETSDSAGASDAAAVPEEVVLGPPSGEAFQQEALKVGQEVAQLLSELESAPLARASLCSSGDVCTITAILGEEQASSFDMVVEKAKDAIFTRTSRSRGVCLLGYKKAPFTMTPQGFTASVGTVVPKRTACRNLYACGACRDDCPWQHPETIVSFNVVVAFTAKHTQVPSPLDDIWAGLQLAACTPGVRQH